jgi:large subunit ribosomal protein L29
MKASELRQMSDEQLELQMREAAETIFRVRCQSQTERRSTSVVMQNRRLIARIKTIQTERVAQAGRVAAVAK